MGDRICLTFVNGERRSPVLYSHWDGRGLLDRAKEFWETYRTLVRDDPANWMVNFIAWLTGTVADGGYYLYPDEERSCSPDDNGFWEFDTATGECRQTRRGDYE